MQYDIQKDLWDEAVRFAEDAILKPLQPNFKQQHDFSPRGHRIMWSTALMARFFFVVNYEFLEAHATKIRTDPQEFKRLADISRVKIDTLKAVLASGLDLMLDRAFESLFGNVEAQASYDRKRSYLKALEQEFPFGDQIEFAAETDRRYWQFLLENSTASWYSEAACESLLAQLHEAARMTLLEAAEARAKAEVLANDILKRRKPKGFGR